MRDNDINRENYHFTLDVLCMENIVALLKSRKNYGNSFSLHCLASFVIQTSAKSDHTVENISV